MDKVLVFHPDRCTGCRLCEVICSLAHTETCDPERSRIRILRMDQKGIYIQTFCQRCEEAACIAACPVSAINNNKSTGAIEINHELCTLCENCIEVCPYKGIYRDGREEKIIACDLCNGTPKCVMYCETGAVEFLEKDSVAIQKKEDSLHRLKELLKLEEVY